jgi:hypothetical protein
MLFIQTYHTLYDVYIRFIPDLLYNKNCTSETHSLLRQFGVRLCEKGEPTSAGDGDEKNTPIITALYTNTHIVYCLYKHTIQYLMYIYGLYLIYYIIRIAPPKRIVSSYVGRLCEKGSVSLNRMDFIFSLDHKISCCFPSTLFCNISIFN